MSDGPVSAGTEPPPFDTETRWRDAERRLALSEESLRLSTEAAEIGIWDLDLLTGTLTWSDRTKAMFGISPGAAADMDAFYAGLHPDDRAATAAAFASALDPAQRKTYDVEYRTVGKEDGMVRVVAAKGRAIFDGAGRCVRAIGTAIDITARRAATARLKASEAELAESELKFRAMTNSIDQMVWSTLPDGTHDYFNQRWYDFTGMPSGSPIDKAWAVIFHPDDIDRANALWRVSLDTGEPYGVEYRLRHHSGVFRWVLVRAVPLREAVDGGEPGRILRWFGTCTDIHDIAAAREILARSREQLEQQVAERTRERDRTWQTSQDLLLVLDRERIIQAVNPAWTALLGYAEDELLGRDVRDFVLEEDRHTISAAVATPSLGAIRQLENRYVAKDGRIHWIAWVAAPDGDRIYASGRHVTAEKEAAAALALTEEKLRQAHKMEAVGQLTGGIAHDFNNLLTGITGSLEMVQRRISAGRFDDVERFATMAVTAAQRAASLTQRLLAFARRQPLDPRQVDANRLVAEMEELLRRTLGPSIALDLVLPADVWPTLCDPNQLESGLLNLAINARDAMPGGGRLTFETFNACLTEADVAQQGDLRPGEYAVVAVTDTGIGMTPEVMARAFDPFFTTKPIGQGTGLGLSMLYGFVKQSGGHIRVTSEAGQGTQFSIYLPRHAGGRDTSADSSAIAGSLETPAGETVLVVDDEPAIRTLVADTLAELGYTVIEAANGAEGLRVLEGGARVDLLLTDVGMPGLNGRQLADAARVGRPGLRVLFMTGYAHGAAVGLGTVLEPGMEIISKPFSLDGLAHKIRAMIGPE